MKGSPGYVLITVLAVSALLAGMLLITLNAASTSRTSIVSDTVKTQAFYAAQSGLERAWARASTRYRAILPANAKTSTQAAQWLAPQLASSGTLPGAGSYTLSANVTAGSGAGDATITLTSTGENTTRSAKRRVKVSFPVRAVKNDYDPGPMIATAPAALSVTDTSSINGSAPVSGDIGGIVARHTFNCPASFGAGTTCQKSRLSPPQYTVRYKGAIPTTFTKGAQLRPTSTAYGQRSEERYIVNSVNRTTGEVTLDVLSDYLASTTSGSAQRRTFPGSGDIEFNQITDVPALLLPPNANFSNVSNNVRQVCSTYACEHYTLSSSELFQNTMGGTLDAMERRFQSVNATVPGTYRTGSTAPCSNTINWLKASSTTITVSECSTPQMLVIDARHLSGSIAIAIGSQQSYHGLLYILGNNNTPVKVASNLGFAGAVIIDNGSAGFDMTGTGNFNTKCDTPDATLKKIAKLCYDKDLLANVRSTYIDLILSDWVVDFNFTGNTWQETP